MAKSELIKNVLSQTLGGAEDDWKRRSVGSDGAGREVRVYDNGKLGKSVTLTLQDSGRYNGVVSPGGAKVNFSLPVAKSFAKAAGATQEDAADKVIDKLLKGQEVPEALVKQAGAALASRFTFAVADAASIGEEEGFYAIITPTKYWEKTGYCYDQYSPLYKVLPEGEDVNDCGTYMFEKEFASASDLAKFLKDRGFVWDRDFQKLTDKRADAPLLPQLEAAEGGAARPKNKGPRR